MRIRDSALAPKLLVVTILTVCGCTVCVLPPREAVACGTCVLPGDVLAPIHPKSIDVALATRAAIEAGILPPTPAELRAKHPDRVMAGMQEATAPTLLKQWLERLKLQEENAPVVHFLLVDSRERQGVEIGNGTFTLQESPSEESTATVIMTRHALRALAQGQMDANQAFAIGILFIDGTLPSSLLVETPTAKPVTAPAETPEAF